MLTFNTLREADVKRLPTFNNAKGEPAHSEPDGSDWTLSQWSNAVFGECGEAANIIKKIERGDFTVAEARESLGKELADAVIYLDLLAFRVGLNLGDAIVNKFNETSRKVGSPVSIEWPLTRYSNAKPSCVVVDAREAALAKGGEHVQP